MSDRRQVEALADDYLNAFRSGDARACAECYTEDAVYVACGSEPVRGRAAIESLHQTIMDSGFSIESIETTDVEVSDGLAYALQRLTGSVGNSIAMLVFKRENDGQWRACAEAEVS